MFILARNELYRLFLSPLAWIILALTQIILAYLFLTHIEFFIQNQARLAAIPGAPGVTELVAVPLLNNAALILLLIAPSITMRMVAEERRNGSLPLLYSAPLSMTQITLGKFLGSFSFFLILLIQFMLMPLSLALGSNIDFILLGSAFLALTLVVASFTAVGLFFSSLSRQPTIAAISTFASLFLLWIIDWAGDMQIAENPISLFNWLSLPSHFEPLLLGEFHSSDIVYFLLIIITFLILTIRRLDSDRLI